MKFNFQSLPKVCISLKRSKGRRTLAQEQFARFGLDVPFIDAVDKLDLVVPEMSPKLKNEPPIAPGVLACASSHLEVMRRASALKLPAICIFEDDLEFSSDFGRRIEYIQNLDGLNFDIFCLGGHYPLKDGWWKPGAAASATQWNHIYKVREMGGTYAYIITRKAYEWVLRNWSYKYGMDQFFSDFTYREFNTYAMTPFCVAHRDTHSDITEGQYTGYENTKWHFSNTPINFDERPHFL